MPPESAVAELTTSSTPAPSAPSSGTPASPAATPSTQAATPATPASTRPTDAASLSKFLQAQDAAADVTPVSSVPDPAAAAITPPGTDPTGSVVDPNASKGPIPFPVHETALRNAREKAVGEYRQKLGWMADVGERLVQSGVSQQEFQTWVQASRAMAADPVQFFSEKFAELQNHPTYGPQIRSTAGRTLASGNNVRPEPDVQVIDQSGQVVSKTYSAERLAELQQWERQQMTGEFRQLVQPLMADREARLTAQREHDTQQQIKTAADRVVGKVDRILEIGKVSEDRKKALYAAVNTVMASNPNMDAEEAAWQVREQQILPSAQAAAEATALETHKLKAAGNTATGNTAALTTARPKNAKELAAWMEAHPGA